MRLEAAREKLRTAAAEDDADPELIALVAADDADAIDKRATAEFLPKVPPNVDRAEAREQHSTLRPTSVSTAPPSENQTEA